MRIVNAHAHLIEVERMLEKYADVALAGGVAVLKEVEASFPLLAPEKLIEQMDEAGIQTTILYAVDAPIVYASNEYVHALCARYPDRFIGFASVNPLEADAPQRLEHAVREYGLLGLKLHPPLQQFAPDDRRVWPVYEKALELDIPVVFHVGTTPFGSLCRLAHANPLLVDEVAVAFPRLRMMLTHLGTLWHNEAFMVVEKNPNVFIDTAAYLSEIEAILTPDIVERIGTDKIIFGTDYPMPYGGRVHRLRDFVDCLMGLKFTEAQRRMVFSENVEALLHGRPEPEGGLTADKIRALASGRGPDENA